MFGVLAVHNHEDRAASIWNWPTRCATKIHRSLVGTRRPVMPPIILPALGSQAVTVPVYTQNNIYNEDPKVWYTHTHKNLITSAPIRCGAGVVVVGGGPKVIWEFVIRNTFRFGQPSWSCSMWRMPCEAATVVTFDRSNSDKFLQFSYKNER